MDYKDYYKIMGLERGASQDEVKRAYRKFARKYHPDVSKEANAEEKFKELGEAYEVLSDTEKRAKYDKYGQHWKEQGQGGFRPDPNTGGAYQGYGFDESQTADFEDFISSIFRQRQAQHQDSFYDKGQDIHAKLTISLEDSFAGAEKTVQLQTPVMGKRGQMHYETRSVKVKIPKGIADKKQIRLKGQGVKGSGQDGDLYIEITISPHPWYTLKEKDIYVQLPIAPWEAALGATIQVPTLAGPVNLKIPKLSQSGKQMRLKGRGLPGHEAGDQYVILTIVIPQEENTKADALYEELAKVTHFNPRERFGVSHGG